MGWRVRRIWPHELARPNAPRLLARLSRALGKSNRRSRVPATAATSVLGHSSLGRGHPPPASAPSFSLPVPVLVLFPVRPRGNRRPVA